MRAGLLLLAIAACSPKGPSTPRPLDDDLEPAGGAASIAARPADPAVDARPVAPPGKGLRSGTVARANLVAVLDAGLPMFLRQLEVEPKKSGDRFVGWQLIQVIDHTGPLHDLDVLPGDVLLSINGQLIARPEQAQAVWDSLRTANEVTAQIWRGPQKLELRFAIDPPVAATAAPPIVPVQVR